MPQIELNGPRTLSLNKALLIYGGDGEVFVTRHDVKGGTIQPGEPVDVATLRELLAAKDEPMRREAGSLSWHKANVIAESPDRRIWWTPPAEKEVFVAGKGVKAWFPALVWCGHRGVNSLYLWAFEGNKAPSPETVVYRPKFGPVGSLNHIHDDSAVCLGDMNPGRRTPADWMKAFFDSNFKTNGNLQPKPYAIKKKFKKLGTLATVAGALGSRE